MRETAVPSYSAWTDEGNETESVSRLRTTSMASRLHLLAHLSDENLRLVTDLLEGEVDQLTIHQALDGPTYESLLETSNLDAIITSIDLGSYSAESATRRRNQLRPNLPVILLLNEHQEEFGARCLKLGADDYIVKPHVARLSHALNRAIEKRLLLAAKLKAESELRKARRDVVRDAILAVNPEDSDTEVSGMSTAVLAALYQLENALNNRELGRETSMQEASNELVHWLRTLDVTGVQIRTGAKVYISDPFKDTNRYVTAQVRVGNHNTGTVELFFKPDAGDREWRRHIENELAEQIASRIGTWLTGDSERRETTRKLALQERLIAGQVEGMLLADRKGVVLLANPAAEAALGHPGKSLVGRDLRDLMPPRDVDALLKHALKLKQDAWWSKDVNLVRAGRPGSRLSVSVSPVIEKDEFDGILLSFKDVSVTEQAEVAAREREEQYQSIFESVTDALIVFDLSGRIVQSNPAACELLGYTLGELMMLTARDIVAKRDQMLLVEFKRRVTEGGDYNVLIRLAKKGGSTFEAELRGSSFDVQGMTRMLAVIRDMSVGRESEKAKAWMMHSLDAAPIGMLTTAVDGSIRWANTHFRKMFGLGLSEVLEKNAREFFRDGESKPLAWTSLVKRIAGQEPGEVLGHSSDGRPLPVYLAINPVTDDRKTALGYVLTALDERKMRHLEGELGRLKREIDEFNHLTQLGMITSTLSSDIEAVIAVYLTESKRIISEMEHSLNETADDLVELYDTMEFSVVDLEANMRVLRGLRDMIHRLFTENRPGNLTSPDPKRIDLATLIHAETTLFGSYLGVHRPFHFKLDWPADTAWIHASDKDLVYLFHQLIGGLQKRREEEQDEAPPMRIRFGLREDEVWMELTARSSTVSEAFLDHIGVTSTPSKDAPDGDTDAEQVEASVRALLIHRLLQRLKGEVIVSFDAKKTKIRISFPAADALQAVGEEQ
ncbi:PAS domain S-box protein [bacterium]|nr:PAS domain S-box protein [bacterium]